MGRPISTTTKELQKIFVAKERQIVENNKIVPPKSTVWAEISKNVSMSEKAVYTAALKWWTIQSEKSITIDRSPNSSSDSSQTETDQSLVVPKLIKFKIELSAKVWEAINPVTKIYSRKNEQNPSVRSYKVLKPGVWSNLMIDHVTKKRRDIPCAWAFETNKCYVDGVNFLTFSAKCTMCCSILSGMLKNEPEESEPVNIDIEIHALDLSRHDGVETKNVRVGGVYAKNLYGMKKPASVIRRDLLRKT